MKRQCDFKLKHQVKIGTIWRKWKNRYFPFGLIGLKFFLQETSWHEYMRKVWKASDNMSTTSYGTALYWFTNDSVPRSICAFVEQSFVRVITIVPDFDQNFITWWTMVDKWKTTVPFEMIDWNFFSRFKSKILSLKSKCISCVLYPL